jgi:hypothetical protein
MENKNIKVKNERYLSRDTHSNAIVNQDEDSYIKYLTMANKNKRKDDEIDMLKNDVKEIKELLTKLLERN